MGTVRLDGEGKEEEYVDEPRKGYWGNLKREIREKRKNSKGRLAGKEGIRKGKTTE